MQAHLRGADRRVQSEHRARMWLAYHTALFYRVKKLPRFDTLVAKQTPRRKARQTWQQQMTIMETWAASIRRAEAARK